MFKNLFHEMAQFIRTTDDQKQDDKKREYKKMGINFTCSYPSDTLYHDEDEAYAAGENYFPEALKDRRYYFPADRGVEQRIREKLDYLRQRDKTSTIRRYD